MSGKYSTKQRTFAQLSCKQMNKIWYQNIRAFLRYRNVRVGTLLGRSRCAWLVAGEYALRDAEAIRFLNLDQPGRILHRNGQYIDSKCLQL